MADLLIAPYLPVGQPARIGSWKLIPLSRLEGSDLLPDELRRCVTRLVAAYQLPTIGGKTLGVVIVPEGELIGAPFDRSLMPQLGRALLAGVIACNPTMVSGEDDDENPNAGWGVATSENSLLYGHPLIDSDSYAIEVGVLARLNAIRHAPEGEAFPKIEPPVELPRPLFSQFDNELATQPTQRLAPRMRLLGVFVERLTGTGSR